MHLINVLKSAALAVTLLLAVYAQAVDKETVLHKFKPKGGSYPSGGLLMDQFGNLYGAGMGFLFELSPNGTGGWTYNSLAATNAPLYPEGPLVMDQVGNLYISNYFGDVFEFSPNGSGGWSGSVIYSLNGGVGGDGPSNLFVDGAGNLYGVNGVGGLYGFGYVFELYPTSGGGWSLTDLYDFNGEDGDASTSDSSAGGVLGGLIMDASGDLYGTTFAGGSSTNCKSGCGVEFKLTSSSGVWAETVLISFDGTDGANPDAPLFMDANGNLYGTTTLGGVDGFGVVFETSSVSGLTSVLHNFTNIDKDGAYPQSALIMDTAGSLYGTTLSGGGSANCSVPMTNGCGTAFMLSPHGSNWKESILHDFDAKSDGGFPGGLVSDSSGNLYSTASIGGLDNSGVVFELSPQKSSAAKSTP